VFSVCLHQSNPLAIFAGLLPWLLFSETVQRSAASLIEQANLITKTVFPAEIIPISIFLSSLVSHLMATSLVVLAAGLMLRHIRPSLALLPVFLVLLGLFAIGIGWIASSLQVYLRDTAQVLTVTLTLWFWITPIFIDEDKYPASVHFLITANPLAWFVRAYRQMLLLDTVPSLASVAIAAGSSIAVFFVGGLFFRYMKRGFADVL
jgi:ABC-type polysaccharide/polyol phosphate export permease